MKMNHQLNTWKRIFLLVVLILLTTCTCKFKSRKKMTLKNKKQFPDSSMISNIGSSSNSHGSVQRDAVTYGTAGDFSKIPTNHPLITSLKYPKYVEQLHYYEDEPLRNSETEAISVEHSNEDYYRPFANKHLIMEAKSVFNCESIISPYVCQESSLCGWDNLVKACFYTNRVVHDIRFLQKEKRNKRRLNKRRLNKNRH